MSKPALTRSRDTDLNEPFTVRNKGGQTEIVVYPIKAREGFVFRYRLGGVEKTVERVTREKIIAAALKKAADIDSGVAQAGNLTAADVESYTHARKLLLAGDPPLHAIVAEWQAARQLLDGRGSLLDAARMWIERAAAGLITEKTVAEVVEEFTGDRASSRRDYDPNALKTVGRRLTAFAAWCGENKTILAVTERDITKYLNSLEVAPPTRKGYRTTIITLFRFAVRRRYLPERVTEAEKVEKEHWVPAETTVWTPAELRTVLAHVKPASLPWIALGAFAGIRTEEICGDREHPQQDQIAWADVFFDEKEILIRASVGKTDEGRTVPIADNLLAWLAQWQDRSGLIMPRRYRYDKETARLRHPDAFVIDWKKNALRHSFASYTYALDRDLQKLTAAMGNSAETNRKHYQSPRFRTAAKEWFSILPPGASGRIIVPHAFKT